MTLGNKNHGALSPLLLPPHCWHLKQEQEPCPGEMSLLSPWPATPAACGTASAPGRRSHHPSPWETTEKGMHDYWERLLRGQGWKEWVRKGWCWEVLGVTARLFHGAHASLARVGLPWLESGPSLIKHPVLGLIGKMKQETAQYGFRLSHGYWICPRYKGAVCSEMK